MPNDETKETPRASGAYIPLPSMFEENQNWLVYVAKINQHFLVYNVTDDNTKRAMLLASLSLDVFDTLIDLCFPEKPEAKSFKEVCSIMESHFVPTVSIFRERRTFYNTKQGSGDSVNEFVARLKQASRHCRFGDYYTSVLRDAFVCGLREGPVRSKVLEMKPTATFEECIEKALNVEAIKAIGNDEDYK